MHASPLARLGEGGNGGLNVYVRDICRALGELGVSTDVFTRVPADRRAGIEILGGRSRLIKVPAGDKDLDRYGLAEAVPAFVSMVSVLAVAQRYDLLYSHYWLSGIAAARVRRRLDIPWAHTAHTLAVVKNQRLAPGAQPEPEERVAAEGHIAQGADLLVVSTAAERQALVQSYCVDPERAVVVTPGVDLTAFKPGRRDAARRALAREDQRLFVIVGRLERLKGVDLALRALASLPAARPEARLLVIGGDGGRPGETARLRALAAKLGIAGQVEFLGPVPQAQLATYYVAADACLLPSYTESFGLVGLEAQACGTPVVASSAAGLASVIQDGETGFLVPGSDPEGYAVAMRRLLEDPGVAERMGRQAAQLAGGFSWAAAAEQLLSRFRQLAARKRPELGGELLAL